MHQGSSRRRQIGFVRIADVMCRTGTGSRCSEVYAHDDDERCTDSVEVESEADWWGIVIDEFGLL